ncbi:hypothetical protein PVAND_001773 [Polypedilum vanderplanki]|uniref:histone acetyltransferase n=1 Tax=Polypedilum vanderplanki TaxID=319348 RepID=A0A9J6BP00_POLVA|nr:hypothetical protein PVAND_001773 [Polypedilum vanderplanki]
MQFYCNNCRATDVSIAKFPKFKLNAENLASTECDEFIARHLSLCGVFIPKKVIIKYSSEKKFEINSPTAKYRSKTAITYNNCSLLAFFKSDDELDICFFACYFQLYGSDCEAKSNRNSVYLSYIDSVNLFKVPDRTKIYQEILIGLFRYLRFRKFSKIFIWSCPPSKQSDYILVGKPLDMKIPTFDILLSWYHKLIILGKKQGVITSFEGPDKYARDNNWFDLDNVPLFEGDLWPTRIQEAVIEAEKEGSNYEYLNKRIWDLLQVQTIGFDNSYFVLYIEQETMTLDAMMPQPSLKCKYTNDRYDLVEFFLDNNLTFHDLRLAAFSTVYIINSIQNLKTDEFQDVIYYIEKKVNNIININVLKLCEETSKRKNIIKKSLNLKF